MKISTMVKKAMADSGVKNATELSKISGVNYGTVIRIINGHDASMLKVVKLFNAMGFDLKSIIMND